MDVPLSAASQSSGSCSNPPTKSLSLSFFGVTLTLSRRQKSQNSCFSVAILAPNTGQFCTSIQDSFIDQLRSDTSHRYCFSTFNAGDDAALLEKHINTILESSHDLILTIGARATTHCKRIMENKNLRRPVVFAGMKDPVKYNVVESFIRPGTSFTGVSGEPYDHRQQLLILQALKPTIKKALIIYDPQDGFLDEDKLRLETLLLSRRISVRSMQITLHDELPGPLTPHLESVDLIIMLRDQESTACINTLVDLCNQRGITLLSSDLPSVRDGAALGYVNSDAEYGIHSAHLARQILLQGKKPEDLPVVQLTMRNKLHLNTATMKQQGIQIDPELVSLIRNIEVL